MKSTLAIVLVALLGINLAAATVDGNWAGSLDTPNGPIPIAFTFLADGNTLTGSTVGPDGSATKIKNGKIDRDKISFAVDVDFGGMPVTIGYTGIVTAEQIALTLDFMGMPFDFAVKRAT